MLSFSKILSSCVLALCLSTDRAFADSQQKNFNSLTQVFVGDLINESNATLDQDHAASLCARLVLGTDIPTADSANEHSQNCIIHIVRFNDPKANATDVQSVAAQNWYVYSNEHFWSLEDLQQNKRLLGSKHVSFFYIFINRQFASDGPQAQAAVVPTPFPNPNQSVVACSPPTAKIDLTQAAGGDSYLTNYQLTVTKKVSANIQQLLALLGAGGLTITGTSNPSTAAGIPSASVGTTHSLLLAVTAKNARPTANKQLTQFEILSNGRLTESTTGVITATVAPVGNSNPTCMDAVYGGGTFDVAYRPSDISIAGSLIKGTLPNQVVVPINSTPYVVDNEGQYYVDFSIPITLKHLNEVQYQTTGTSTFSPVNVDSTNAFYGVDIYPVKVDVKNNVWPKWPSLVMGIGFAKQPLHNLLVGGSWGPLFSQVYMGAAFIDQPRVASNSNSCSASAGSSQTTSAPFGYHYCPQFSIGLNLTVTGFASKLGAPK